MADDDLVRLIREVVKQELSRHSRLATNELTSKTGDLNLTAMGNIHIDPANGKKAYYNGVEFGFGKEGNKIWLNAAHTAWMYINNSGTLVFHVTGGIQEEPV